MILVILTIVFFVNLVRNGKLPKLLVLDYVFVILSFFFETIFFFNIFQNTHLWACIYDTLFPVAITISVIVKFYYLNKIKSEVLWIYLFSYGLIIFAVWFCFPKIKFEISYSICIFFILILFVTEVFKNNGSSTLHLFQLPILALSIYFSGFSYVIDKHYLTMFESLFLKPFSIVFLIILNFNLLIIYAKYRRLLFY